MSEFSYVRAHSLDEAVTLLNEPGLRNRVLAGGTDLVNQFRDGAVSCDRVVDVTHVPELKIIQVDSRITIGAAVTHTDIGASEVLQQQAPFLVQACRQIGSPQIRNIATIGGNVVNAAACADTLPVLVCLGAQAIIATVDGERQMPVAELVTGAGRQPDRISAYRPPPGHVNRPALSGGRWRPGSSWQDLLYPPGTGRNICPFPAGNADRRDAHRPAAWRGTVCRGRQAHGGTIYDGIRWAVVGALQGAGYRSAHRTRA